MSAQQFTLDDLKRILLEGAGADEPGSIKGDILDLTFEDLGYESLALLETGGRIEREYGIALDDDALDGSLTPRSLIQSVNALLDAGSSAA